MIAVLARARVWVVVAALSVVLVSVDVQAQSDAQSSARRSRRAVAPVQQVGALTAAQRAAQRRCERLMLTSEYIRPSSENSEMWHRELCRVSNDIGYFYVDVGATPYDIEAYEFCVSAIAPHYRQNAYHALRACNNATVIRFLNPRSARNIFRGCMGRAMNNRNNHSEYNIYSNIINCTTPDLQAIAVSPQNIAAYEACITEVGVADALSGMVVCAAPQHVRIFRVASLKKMYKECLNEVRRTGAHRNRNPKRYCLDEMSEYLDFVYDNPVYMRIYTECRAVGYSSTSCINDALQAYYRTQDRGASEPSLEDVVTGAGD